MRLYDYAALWVLPDGTERRETFRARSSDQATEYVAERMYRDSRERAKEVHLPVRRGLYCKDLRLVGEPVGAGYCVPHRPWRDDDDL